MRDGLCYQHLPFIKCEAHDVNVTSASLSSGLGTENVTPSSLQSAYEN